VKPGNVVLVHGEATEMRRLYYSIRGRVSGAFMPGNAEAVELRFRDDHTVSIMGRLVSWLEGGGWE